MNLIEPIRLIIVEDEPAILQGITMLMRRLENLPLQITGTYSNGKEALDHLSESQPEIVITDVQMPVMSGLELISQMQEQNYPAKYLVLSGYAEFQYVQQALRLSVCNYLLKPPRIQELQEAMKKICDQILLERQLRSNELLGDVLSEYRQIDFSSFLSKEAPSSETTSSDLSERSSASAESSDGQIQKTVEMLHEKIQTDFSNNIDINEFAKLHGYHPVYLITQFSKIYQISPTQFIKQLKMESAKKLLRTTEKSLSEIAESVGYYDVSHFSRSFKAYEGCSPGCYRKNFSR